MKSVFFWPYQLYVYLLFLPFVVVWTVVCATLAIMVATWISQSAASRWVARNYARVIGWLTPVPVQVEGRERLDPEGAYVVVANHVSQYDIVVIYGWLPLDLRWVIKQELRRVPAIGIGCEKVGHIFVDRSDPAAARRAISDAVDRLGDGVGILFFPEGTRSRDGGLLPFKKGAFRVAIEQGLPVLPVTVLGTHDILPAKTLRLFPGRARLVIHDPIPTDGLGPGDVERLTRQAREAIGGPLPPTRRGDATKTDDRPLAACT